MAIAQFDGKARRLTQQERSDLSERRLMDAALELMGRQGYERTTVAQISTQAGYSPGLVNHRFGSKLELLEALIERGQREFQATKLAPALDDRHGLDALLTATDVRLTPANLSEGTRAFYTVMGECFGPVPQIRPAYQGANETMRASLEAYLVEAQQAGDVRSDLDAKVGASILVGIIRGLVYQHLLDPDRFDMDAARAELREWLIRAFAPLLQGDNTVHARPESG